MSQYEVLAVQYAGPFPALAAFLYWHEDGATCEEENYYVWCIRGNGTVTVVDTGARPELLSRRKPPSASVRPCQALQTIGVDCSAVRQVVLTHLHWDHCGGIDDFPQATFYLGTEEYDFWIDNPVAKRAPFASMADPESHEYLRGLKGTDRLVLLDHDQEIAEGIRCITAPGHTPGLVAVAVETTRGTAVIGSDAAHVFANLERDWPSAFTYDRITCVRTYDKLRATASHSDLIFPGHDHRLASDYPRVTDRVTRLA
jgi:glyoxylase-like metal-dependent hydrolase (beta-lactamase superfamily II)